VINNKVRVQPAAVSHGSLTVTISENRRSVNPTSFPAAKPWSPAIDVQVEEERKRMFVFNAGVSLDEIVKAVNNVGAGPSDLVAILEALKLPAPCVPSSS